MKVPMPNMREQLRVIHERATQAAIEQLNANLNAPVLPGLTDLNEADYSRAHLLMQGQGWQAPDADIVAAYFRHFQSHFSEYNTDKKLSVLLGLSSDRRVREFKSGAKKVPYDVWRKFLILTGRAPQDVIPVLAFMA
ncbi:hypothetical protein K6Y31_20580 [Motilimonas cestriensis]|uniref:Uncharacterized protein n=1 Tax=Motilimonas cestriensis TaxID=2742685 RepID=A0ABS8WDQ4_9GAMM|nr:hypothetical protein [Motilimonas cestriensis]MCE2597174.1 hypothetical protein [Motilimonas cestriensis]